MLLLPGWAVAQDDPCEEVVQGSGLQAATELTGRLARQLDLPPPAWVELAPVPDLAAGVTYGPVIRLRPAPEPILLATLLHETGHLGPRRSRDVEEAIADLTRRALLALMLTEEPGKALPLLPVLVPPLLSEQDLAHPQATTTPLIQHAGLYRHAYILAASLWDHAGPGLPDGEADPAARLARAAALGRTLTSVEIRELLPRDGEGLTDLLDRFSQGHVLPLLDQALPFAGERTAQIHLLQAALNLSHDPSAWLQWARAALAMDDADRILAHEVLARRLPGAEGELLFLGQWVIQARSAGADLSLQRARVRRGTALGLAGREKAGSDELMEVLLGGEEPFAAMEAAAGLAMLTPLSAGDLEGLLDMAPSLAACGPAGTAFKALTLREAGYISGSLALFIHGHLPAPGWAWHAAWAEALAAGGDQGGAVELLRSRAKTWRRQPGGDVPAAAALMAAVTIEGPGDGRAAWEAAMALRKVGGWSDDMLAAAARRWQETGRKRRSRRAWKKLLRQVPHSDLAAAARAALGEALDGRDQSPGSVSVSGPEPSGRVMKQAPPRSRAER